MKKGDIIICIKERPDADFKIYRSYVFDFAHEQYYAVYINNSSVAFALKSDDEKFNNEHYIFEDHFISLKEQRKLKLDKIEKL